MYVTIFRTFRVGIYLLGIVFMLFHQSVRAQTPTPVACYNFSGNLQEANGGPSLTGINGAGTYSYGAAICGTDSFYNWTVDQGLDLFIGTLFPKNHYTIEFLFKFTSVPYQRSWQRVINFKNSTSDLGLYTFGSGSNYNLQMYTQNTGTTNMAGPNTWLHLFVTRDSVTNVMNVYLNDSLQITFTDNLSAGVFISDLILFKDDNVVPNEESAGTIDYLRIFDQPLTKAQITYIVNIAQPALSINGNLTVCNGDSTLLTANGAANYLWSTGATTSSVYVSPSSATDYSVVGWNYLFCTKSCPSYDTVTVAVNSNTAVSISPDSTVCSGSEVQLQSSGGTSYLWQPSTGLTDSTVSNPGAIALTTTTYTVTASNGNCSGTATITITVLPVPQTPVITQFHDTLHCSTDSDYVSYQWYADSTIIPGDTNPDIIVSAAGNYNVQITNKEGCNIAAGINVLFTGISSASSGYPAGIVLYPDPVGDQLNIIVKSTSIYKSGNYSVIIFNALGEEILNQQAEIQNSKLHAIADVSSLSPGIYFVKIETGEQTSFIKFMKE